MSIRTLEDWFGAIERGDLRCVQESLGIFGDSVDRDGETGLMKAVRSNNSDIVRVLIPKCAGQTNENGLTALMIAALENKGEMCSRLVMDESDVTTKEQQTALMLAAGAGATDAVQALLPYQKGRRDARGRTALMYAAEAGHLVIAEALLPREKAMISHDEKTALILAAENCHTEVVGLLTPHESTLLPDATRQVFLNYSESEHVNLDVNMQLIDVMRSSSNSLVPPKTALETELEARIRQLEMRLVTLHDQSSVVLGENLGLHKTIGSLHENITTFKLQIDSLLAETADKSAIIQNLERRLQEVRASPNGSAAAAAMLDAASSLSNLRSSREDAEKYDRLLADKDTEISRLQELLNEAARVLPPLSPYIDNALSADFEQLRAQLSDYIADNAKKDETIQQLRKELEEAQQGMPTVNLDTTKGDVARLLGERDALKKRINDLEGINSSLQRQLDFSTEKLHEKDAEIAELDTRCREYAGEIQSLSKQLVDAEERAAEEIAALHDKLISKDAEISNLSDELQAARAIAEAKLAAAEGMVDQLQKRVQDLENDLIALQIGGGSARANPEQDEDAKRRLQAEIDRLKELADTREEEAAGLRKEVTDLTDECEKLRNAFLSAPTTRTIIDESSSNDAKIAQMLEQLEDAATRIRDLESAHAGKDEVIKTLRKQLVGKATDPEMANQLLKKEEELGDLKARLADAVREISDLRSSARDAEDIQQALDKVTTDYAKLMEDFDEREQEIKRLRDELRDADDTDELKNQILCRDAEITDLKNDLAEKEDTITSLQNQLSVQPTTSTIVEEGGSDMEDAATIKELQSENQFLREALESEKQTNSEKDREIQGMDTELARLKLRLDESLPALDTLRSEVELLKSTVVDKDKEIVDLKNTLDERATDVPIETVDALNAMLEDINQELAVSKQEVERLKDQLDDKEKNMADMRLKERQKEAELDELSNMVQASMVGPDKAAEMSALKDEIRSLHNKLAANESEIEQTKGDLLKKQEEMERQAAAISYYQQLVEDLRAGIATLDDNLASLQPQ